MVLLGALAYIGPIKKDLATGSPCTCDAVTEPRRRNWGDGTSYTVYFHQRWLTSLSMPILAEKLAESWQLLPGDDN